MTMMTSLRSLVQTLIGLISALVLLSFESLPPLAHDVSSGASPYLEQADLAEIIKSRNVDEIRDALNEVKQMHYQGQILPYLLDLWNLRQDKYPELPWDVISLDIVRLEIGNVLAQASRNRFIEIDSNAIHDFAVGLIHSADVEVASTALWTLAIFDREQDVSEIKGVALTTRAKPFYLAVMALASMCNVSAAKALTELKSADLTKEQVSFIVERIEKSAGFKQRTGRCKESGE